MTPEKRRTLQALLFGCFMVSMDRTIVSIALPTITAELQATISYAWIASAYLFASALILPVAGRMLDIAEGRRLMLGAVSVFVFGSALCGLSVSLEMLAVSRFIQGLGGGSFLALAAGLVGLLYDSRERGLAIGKLGMVLATSSVVGPILGGLLTDHLSWRSIFLVNLPTGLAVFWILSRNLPDMSPTSRQPMDWRGALALTLWSMPLLALAADSKLNHPLDPKVLAVLAFILAALIVFVWLEARCPHPLFPLELFRGSVFRWSALAIVAIGAGSAATAMYLPLYLVQVLELTTMQAGLTLTTMVLGIMLGSHLLGRATARLGRTKPVLLTGTALVTLALLDLSFRLEVQTSVFYLMPGLFLAGLGFGLSTSGYPLAAQNAAPSGRMGTVTSSIQFSKSMGGALGTALLGSVLTVTLNQAFPAQLEERLQSDGMPSEVSLFQEPKEIHHRFQSSLAISLRALEECQSGQEDACRKLLDEPLAHGLEPAKLKSLEKDEQVKEFLTNRFTAVGSHLEESAKEAFRLATQRVLRGAALFAFLAFFLTLWMKEDRVAKEAIEQSRSPENDDETG